MNSAIIVAAGSGKRMGTSVPKQFIKINGVSILAHTLRKFIQSNIFNEIIIVLSKDYLEEGEILKETMPVKIIKICEGGKERFHSVKNALEMVNTNCKNIFIHDSVRPFFSESLLHVCLTQCQKNESAIPSIPIKDSIRSINDHGNSKIVDRTKLRGIQTPQVFNFEKLNKAYQQDFSELFTDDASVYESNGNTIHLINGEGGNIKITTPEDLHFAKSILG